MLFQSINKIKRSSIITSLLLIALGVVMIICPGSYTMSLISGMGYAGMILAAVMVLEYLDSKKAFMNGVLLFFALAIGLLGLAVVVFRDSVLQILGWTFGILLILQGVELGEAHRSADYKTELQELVQRRADQHIAYELIGESGPDHMKRFQASVSCDGNEIGTGEGKTKKEAEQMAARAALDALNANAPGTEK